ncbi:MAG: cellulase family glycosylhydrolase [Clostridia bacterium]|nr:cellulase family glycosylhydrolase [Clostridia bacterium]
MADFLLGCNYWASNAGADMWRDFSLESIEKDLKILSEYGVKTMRVFPNWRDFQPIEPLFGHGGQLERYTVKGKPFSENPYYLDGEMLARFSLFLDLCNQYGIRVIVGLITGWMSGALFVPSALYGQNLLTSPVALYFEQLFIKGFVEHFKNRDEIYAWDLGNECNCMADAGSRFGAASWTAMISNAIKASDSDRPIVSGMHGLSLDGKWTIEDQGMFTDILTTHPYPFWCQFTRIDETLSLRTTMHPTAQNKFYADIGKKPCLAEEIGTMGPMICSDENSADFLRINLFSLFANGASGVMWWCANDQDMLTNFPYSDHMVECELGMLDQDHNPKPVLQEMKKFADVLDSFDFVLPAAQSDAVCLLTRDQEHWGVAYMTYILARQAGFNCSFAYADDELPDSSLYLMPSVNSVLVMHKERYEALKKKVYEGADLYISIDNAVLSGFEELAGLKVLDCYEHAENGYAEIGGEKFVFSRTRNVLTEATTAEVLAYDSQGYPFLSVNRYGRGRVFFVNAPIESALINRHRAFDGNTHLLYRKIFGEYVEKKPVTLTGDGLFMTYHPTEDGAFAVILNHGAQEKEFSLNVKEGYALEKVYYGEVGRVLPYDACVLKIVRV